MKFQTVKNENFYSESQFAIHTNLQSNVYTCVMYISAALHDMTVALSAQFPSPGRYIPCESRCEYMVGVIM